MSSTSRRKYIWASILFLNLMFALFLATMTAIDSYFLLPVIALFLWSTIVPTLFAFSNFRFKDFLGLATTAIFLLFSFYGYFNYNFFCASELCALFLPLIWSSNILACISAIFYIVPRLVHQRTP